MVLLKELRVVLEDFQYFQSILYVMLQYVESRVWKTVKKRLIEYGTVLFWKLGLLNVSQVQWQCLLVFEWVLLFCNIWHEWIIIIYKVLCYSWEDVCVFVCVFAFHLFRVVSVLLIHDSLLHSILPADKLKEGGQYCEFLLVTLTFDCFFIDISSFRHFQIGWSKQNLTGFLYASKIRMKE